MPALTRKRPFSERLGDQVVPPTKRFEYNRGGKGILLSSRLPKIEKCYVTHDEEDFL